MMVSENASLCWRCDRACRNQCSWASDFIPVKGWNAELIKHETMQSYCVYECPEFVRSKPIRSTDEIDNDGMMNLLEAFVKQIRSDYLKGTPEMKKNIERYLLGRRGKKMLQGLDTDFIVKELQHMAKVYATQRLRDMM